MSFKDFLCGSFQLIFRETEILIFRKIMGRVSNFKLQLADILPIYNTNCQLLLIQYEIIIQDLLVLDNKTTL